MYSATAGSTSTTCEIWSCSTLRQITNVAELAKSFGILALTESLGDFRNCAKPAENGVEYGQLCICEV